MIEGTLWRIRWCRIFQGASCEPLLTGIQRVAYLFECSGRRSINSGTWYNSCFTMFRFFDEKDQPYWVSVLVIEVAEVKL